MGFWDTAGKVAKGAYNALEEKSAEIAAIKARYQSKSSQELQEIIQGTGFFSATSMEKRVAMVILKERGDA